MHVRALAAALALAALPLAACSDEDSSLSASVTSAETPAASAPAAAGTRTVAHAKGETAVPISPQRIVTLDSPILDAAIFLGLTPVGAVRTSVDTGLPDYRADRTEDVEIVGEITNLSSEEISRADADILFTTTYGKPDDTTRGAVTPLWGQLRAVENGCQFDVSDDTWMVGIGLIGAQAILDDLERALGDGDCGVYSFSTGA